MVRRCIAMISSLPRCCSFASEIDVTHSILRAPSVCMKASIPIPGIVITAARSGSTFRAFFFGLFFLPSLLPSTCDDPAVEVCPACANDSRTAAC